MTPRTNEGNYTNGWGEWSKHVLLELERLNERTEGISTKINDMKSELMMLVKEVENIKGLEEKIHNINVELATIKMKFSMIGAAIGGAAAIIVQVGSLLLQYFKG